MKKFKVRIEEQLAMDIEVEAVSLDDAINKVEDEYKEGEHVLDSENYVATDFIGICEICPDCGNELKSKMIDLDGTNLDEREVCEECGYGYPEGYNYKRK